MGEPVRQVRWSPSIREKSTPGISTGDATFPGPPIRTGLDGRPPGMFRILAVLPDNSPPRREPDPGNGPTSASLDRGSTTLPPRPNDLREE
jgi:hypothetical protein